MEKPHSPSCDRNKEAIVQILSSLLKDKNHILEIGTGTGQHAVYFAARMPHLIWQCSDRLENHSGIRMWLDEADLENTPDVIELEVNSTWPSFENEVDAIFSANVVHIMSWDSVCKFIKSAAESLAPTGLMIFYGPFNYNGEYTSEGNANFDIWLKDRDSKSAIRDFEAMNNEAGKTGFTLQRDFEMPANNRILVWKKLL